MRLDAQLVVGAVFATLLSACAGGYGATRSQSRGLLRFEVEPESTVVEIDEEYSGLVAGWVEGVVPVAPGIRRVTLRADGYITQRFDVEVAAHEEVTFVLKLEPVLELQDEENPKPASSPRLQRAGI